LFIKYSKAHMATLSKLGVLCSTTKLEGGIMILICILENNVLNRLSINQGISGTPYGVIIILQVSQERHISLVSSLIWTTILVYISRSHSNILAQH
jgi:hypothetical protein